MDTISLKIHKGFGIKGSHPYRQPCPPPWLWAQELGTCLPPGLTDEAAPFLATQTALSFSLEFLLSCGLVAKWQGWAERWKVNYWERWMTQGREAGESSAQVLRRWATCCVREGPVLTATCWLRVWDSSVSSLRCCLSFQAIWNSFDGYSLICVFWVARVSWRLCLHLCRSWDRHFWAETMPWGHLSFSDHVSLASHKIPLPSVPG